MQTKFQEWFYSLPLWSEIDNYIYFFLAGFLMWLLPFENEALISVGGTLIGALIIKGRGNGKQSTGE